jgi:hypothetical protein
LSAAFYLVVCAVELQAGLADAIVETHDYWTLMRLSG